MIIGTAGHIDHGKTSLVRALTGVDTDRLKEEKRRGITIELGFASLTLPDGRVAGVVDVPGHERFVKAMAAGAGGVDVALLVVACDEGVMPQTREHLDILRLLGVRKGVVALTKSDLLDELGAEWLDLIKLDLASLSEGTFLEGAELVPVSSKSGKGLDELVAALGRATSQLEERSSDGPAFLPIDRAFTLKGFGTVVTGTLLSGALAVEEQVSLLPGLDGPLRVRSLQSHGKPEQKLSAGARAAVNLPDVETDSVERGMVLVRYGELQAARMLDVELELLPAADKPLPRRSKLLLHLGTAQAEAAVSLLDVTELRPGEKAFAQLKLEAPLAALPGQRFILRGSAVLEGRGTTVAGGRVLSLSSARRRKGASELLRPLAEGDAEARISWLLRNAGYRGLSAKELFARAGVPQKALTRSIELLSTRGQALLIDREKRHYVSGEVLTALNARALSLLEGFHAANPSKEGLSREELRQKLSPELDPRVFSRVQAALLDGGKAELSGELMRLQGRGRTLTASDADARVSLIRQLEAAALAPPTVNELAAKLNLPASRTLELLRVCVSEGGVVKVSDELYFSKGALDSLRERLVSHLREHKEITTPAFKELVGQSRKFVIPLSEYFDREKVTLRVGEKRVLRRA